MGSEIKVRRRIALGRRIEGRGTRLWALVIVAALVLVACDDADTFTRADGPLEGSNTETLDRTWTTDGLDPAWVVTSNTLGFAAAGGSEADRRAYVENRSEAVAVEWTWAVDGPAGARTSGLVHTDPRGSIASGLRVEYLVDADGFVLRHNDQPLRFAEGAAPQVHDIGRIEVRSDRVRFLHQGEVVIGWTYWEAEATNRHGLFTTDHAQDGESLARFSSFAIDDISRISVPAIDVEFEVISPRPGAVVLNQAPVAVKLAGPHPESTVRVSVDGETQMSFLPGEAPIVSLAGVEPGPATLSFEVLDPSGAALATRTVEVVVDHVESSELFEELDDRFEAGQIGVDDFLVQGLLSVATSGDGDHDSATGEVFDHLSRLWQDASSHARAAADQMGGAWFRRVSQSAMPYAARPPTVAAYAAAPTCDVELNIGLFDIFGHEDRLFCEYIIPASGTLPDGTPRVAIRWLYESTLDGAGSPEFLSQLDGGADWLWEAQELWTAEVHVPGVSRRFELPPPLRNGDPLSLVVVDADGQAISSPFPGGQPSSLGGVSNVPWTGTSIAHPIRLRMDQVSDATLVHELFHTFQWNLIHYTNDIMAGSTRGVTNSLLESSANWGLYQFIQNDRDERHDWDYNTQHMRDHWLVDPSQPFLDWGFQGTQTIKRAYAYFPALEWLDQNAGTIDGAVGRGPRNFIRRTIARYARMTFGGDPIDLFEVGFHPRWVEEGHEPYFRVMPRMWTALYLMTEGERGSAFDTHSYRWAHFWEIPANTWRSALGGNPATAGDAFGAHRPGRFAPLIEMEPEDSVLTRSVNVNRGGAAFIDVELPSDHQGVVKIGVTPASEARGGKFESLAILYDGRHPNVCLDEDNTPQIVLSDGERNPIGGTTLELEFNPDCRRFTAGVVHTDPNSGAGIDSFELTIWFDEIAPYEQEPDPDPELPPDDTEIPPGEPWPWGPAGAIATGAGRNSAPNVCFKDETILSSYMNGSIAQRYALLWVRAGESLTFNVTGEILPSRYWGNGRGEYYYRVRVFDGDTKLYEDWNYAATDIVWHGGPYAWEPPFGARRIGTWTNNTGENKVVLLELEAQRSYAGAGTRWNVHVTGGDGSGPSC